MERGSHSDSFLRQLYRELLLPRLIEERMLTLLRQGKVSKWFSGIGQEAVSVGSVLALEEGDWLLPMHRNLGMFTARKVPLRRLFAQFLGKAEGYTSGRDRSFHFGETGKRIVGMISHVGAMLPVADGIALGEKLAGSGKVALAITGDGGTSEGDFHEALNLAAVWNLPVLFVIENNGYGLSTPNEEQFRCKTLADKGAGYGIPAETIDGNDVLKVHETVSRFSEKIRRKPHPVILECLTFRMRGHEEASGTQYVPEELVKEWAKKDPVLTYEKFLLSNGVMDNEMARSMRKEIIREITEAFEAAYTSPPPQADTEKELADVCGLPSIPPAASSSPAPAGEMKERRFVDAISDGLREAMRRHRDMVIMGQDIAEYGGVFKVTERFAEEFGKERVRNTPLCESAILGAALGLSITGRKSVVEMQFADFVTCGFNQIVNNLAKSRWRWGQRADVVIRMPTGAGVGAGPFHSQSPEAWFFHVPGLKIVYPSTPADAKGLLTAAVEEPGPVMFFEHKALYRSIRGDVPEGYFTVPIGKANIVREGDRLTIITYGAGVHWALKALEENPLSADLIDLRTLLPLDMETIHRSVRKTGKVIILHEDTLTGGIGAEIASLVAEKDFDYLDAPVFRVAALDTPVPFSAELEKNFLPPERFREQLLRLANW